jgi:hypothetical protein
MVMIFIQKQAFEVNNRQYYIQINLRFPKDTIAIG